MKDKHQKYFDLVGKNLRQLRKNKGLSQQDLANLCDVDRAKISTIETAKEDFVFTTLLELADALQVEPKLLLDFEVDFTEK
jgi:transcriptional regulator with XRE-family HTH domain